MLKINNATIKLKSFHLKIDLTIKRESITAVIGPSGSGKSTLFDMIGGFNQVDSGSVLWEDNDIGNLLPAQRPITVLFQDNNLFPHLNTYQNVALGLTTKLKNHEKFKFKIDDALEKVDMIEHSHKYPSELSGGQKGRTALARALVRKKPLLLLDEPFSALGPGLRREMLNLVREISHKNKLTVMIVTHDPAELADVCQDVIVVAEYSASGPYHLQELLKNPPKSLNDYL